MRGKIKVVVGGLATAGLALLSAELGVERALWLPATILAAATFVALALLGVVALILRHAERTGHYPKIARVLDWRDLNPPPANVVQLEMWDRHCKERRSA